MIYLISILILIIVSMFFVLFLQRESITRLSKINDELECENDTFINEYSILADMYINLKLKGHTISRESIKRNNKK